MAAADKLTQDPYLPGAQDLELHPKPALAPGLFEFHNASGNDSHFWGFCNITTSQVMIHAQSHTPVSGLYWNCQLYRDHVLMKAILHSQIVHRSSGQTYAGSSERMSTDTVANLTRWEEMLNKLDSKSGSSHWPYRPASRPRPPFGPYTVPMIEFQSPPPVSIANGEIVDQSSGKPIGLKVSTTDDSFEKGSHIHPSAIIASNHAARHQGNANCWSIASLSTAQESHERHLSRAPTSMLSWLQGSKNSHACSSLDAKFKMRWGRVPHSSQIVTVVTKASTSRCRTRICWIICMYLRNSVRFYDMLSCRDSIGLDSKLETRWFKGWLQIMQTHTIPHRQGILLQSCIASNF